MVIQNEFHILELEKDIEKLKQEKKHLRTELDDTLKECHKLTEHNEGLKKTSKESSELIDEVLKDRNHQKYQKGRLELNIKRKEERIERLTFDNDGLEKQYLKDAIQIKELEEINARGFEEVQKLERHEELMKKRIDELIAKLIKKIRSQMGEMAQIGASLESVECGFNCTGECWKEHYPTFLVISEEDFKTLSKESSELIDEVLKDRNHQKYQKGRLEITSKLTEKRLESKVQECDISDKLIEALKEKVERLEILLADSRGGHARKSRKVFDLQARVKELEEINTRGFEEVQKLERHEELMKKRIDELEENNTELARIIGEYPSPLTTEEQEEEIERLNKLKEDLACFRARCCCYASDACGEDDK